MKTECKKNSPNLMQLHAYNNKLIAGCDTESHDIQLHLTKLHEKVLFVALVLKLQSVAIFLEGVRIVVSSALYTLTIKLHLRLSK